MKASILVVDGSECVANMIGLFVRRLGCQVTASVSTCQEAIASVLSHPPDLALVDMDLAGEVTGPVLVRYLTFGLGIRVLPYNASARADGEAETRALGVRSMLAGPLRPEDFRFELESVLLSSNIGERRIKVS